MKTKVFLLSISLFIIPSFFAFAQLDTGFLNPVNELTSEPQYPQPGDVVTLTVLSYGTQLSNSDIVWRKNGVVIADANNRREVKIEAGELGQKDTITATVINPSGSTQVFAADINPVYLDIVIEPQTRTPDFYEGRALPSIGSQINVTALVNDGQIRENLRYLWRLNNSVLEGGPIRGSNQVSFDMPRGSQALLSLEVSELNGLGVAKRTIAISSAKPELVFYESNTLYGQSHIGITKTLILSGAAATVLAEPYYLDIRTFNNPDIDEWKIDNVLQSNNAANPYQITIQQAEAGGSSNISFHVRSTSELLQGAQGNFNVSY